jgi:hypothetical protein
MDNAKHRGRTPQEAPTRPLLALTSPHRVGASCRPGPSFFGWGKTRVDRVVSPTLSTQAQSSTAQNDAFQSHLDPNQDLLSTACVLAMASFFFFGGTGV